MFLTPMATSTQRMRLFWLLQCVGWLCFGVAMFAWGLEYWSPADALANKLSQTVSGFLLTLGLWRLYRHFFLGRLSAVPLVLWTVAVSFGAAALWIEVSNLSFAIYWDWSRDLPYTPRLVSIPLGNLLYFGFVLLVWSALYLALSGWFDLESERLRALQAENLAQAARLKALRSQLEPHFVFNTLNAISTLIAEEKNREASQMVSRLSDFLRLTLETADVTDHSLAEEIDFVRQYLEIEHTRFGDRLSVQVHVAPEIWSARVPALILQPLVENAVKHGLQSLEGKGNIRIDAYPDSSHLRINIQDDGIGIPGDLQPNGIGLLNVSERLHELFGTQASLSVTARSQGGTSAMVTLPLSAHLIARMEPTVTGASGPGR